jgi:menaquinone-dependent protoporphyrinogen IX oxidase
VLEKDGYEHALKEYVNHRMLDALNIKSVTAFAGRLELNAVDWEDRWTLAARYDGKEPPGSYNRDFRDWHKIRAWAHEVADKLLPA